MAQIFKIPAIYVTCIQNALEDNVVESKVDFKETDCGRVDWTL